MTSTQPLDLDPDFFQPGRVYQGTDGQWFRAEHITHAPDDGRRCIFGWMRFADGTDAAGPWYPHVLNEGLFNRWTEAPASA